MAEGEAVGAGVDGGVAVPDEVLGFVSMLLTVWGSSMGTYAVGVEDLRAQVGEDVVQGCEEDVAGC